MTDHLTSWQVEDFHRGRLSPEELLGVDEHLEHCQSCRRELAAVLDDGAILAAMRTVVDRAATDHLAYDQLEAYVDDRLEEDQRRRIDDHVAICSECCEELRDLVSLAQVLDSEPALVDPAPAETEVLPFRPRDQVETVSPRRFMTWAAAAALLTVAVATLFVSSQQSSELESDIADLRQEMSLLEERLGEANSTIETLEDELKARSPVVDPTEASSEGRPSSVAVGLRDGSRRLTLTSAGELSGVEFATARDEQIVLAALAERTPVLSSQLSSLIAVRDRLMGGSDTDETFGPLAPVGTVVASPRPELRWTANADATGYTVEIYDDDFEQVFSSSQLERTSFDLPEALQEGSLYSWQVTAHLEDGDDLTVPVPPAPQARFRVIDQTTASALDQARRYYGESPLVLGLLYAEAGLFSEAERELEKLVATNPEAELPKQLLAGLRDLVTP